MSTNTGNTSTEKEPTPLQGVSIRKQNGAVKSQSGTAFDADGTGVSEQEIAERAYSIYQMRGSRDGECEANWAQAEQELHAERKGAPRQT